MRFINLILSNLIGQFKLGMVEARLLHLLAEGVRHMYTYWHTEFIMEHSPLPTGI